MQQIKKCHCHHAIMIQSPRNAQDKSSILGHNMNRPYRQKRFSIFLYSALCVVALCKVWICQEKHWRWIRGQYYWFSKCTMFFLHLCQQCAFEQQIISTEISLSFIPREKIKQPLSWFTTQFTKRITFHLTLN